MALASVSDVLRLLGQSGTDATRDAAIASALQASEEWVRRYLRWNPDQTGTQTLKFYDYREDAMLPLPPGATVTAVRGYWNSSGTAETMTTLSDYEVEDRIRLRLRGMHDWPYGSGGSEWAGPEPLPSKYYERIEVDVTLDSSCSAIPASIVTGTALIAGALYERSAQEMQGITSESIGGYSYSLGGSVTGNNQSATWIPRAAITFLKPYRKRVGAFVP